MPTKRNQPQKQDSKKKSVEQNYFDAIQKTISHLQGITINQTTLIHHLIIALLAGKHILLEGMPGTAKTATINALAKCLKAQFNRVQFTSDMLPSDITGSEIYNPVNQKLEWQSGPIFANFVLADEINRAPAKVQSAMLEAMEEHQVTFAGTMHSLPKFFMVCATQNPLDRKGTWELPQAQLDRFMLKTIVPYPDSKTYVEILNLQSSPPPETKNVTFLDEKDILAVRNICSHIHVAEAIMQYIANICTATHNCEPDKPKTKLQELTEFGISPRGAINLAEAARINAWLNQRNFVTPDDVISIAQPVLRHRIIPSFYAESQALTSDDIIEEILQSLVIAPNAQFRAE